MLQPKKTKFRKMHKGRNTGTASRGNSIVFGDFGIKSTTLGRLSARQIEATRRVLTRHIHRQGKVIIRVFPDKPITKKPLEVRQGKGKGSVDHWVALVKPGTVLFEIKLMGNLTEEIAIQALEKAFSKLPVKVKIAKRRAF